MARNMDVFYLKKLLDQLGESQPPTDKALRAQKEYMLAVSIGRDLLKAMCTLEDMTDLLQKLRKQFQNEINQGDTEYKEEFKGYVSALEKAALALRGGKEIPQYPESRKDSFTCGECEQSIAYQQGYCSKCGQRFDWDGVQDVFAVIQ